MRILLAEDNELNQQLGVRLLQRQGHEVILARDGREAVQLATSAPENFDVVLMDMQMPIMDGIEATTAIREHEARAETGGRVPIIALTAHFGPDKLRQCLEAGMDGGVTKPLDLTQLEAAIAKAREEAGAISGSEGARAPVIGWDAALDLVLGDEALLRDMAGLFLERADGMLAAIVDAHAQGDDRALERAAHKLKGSAGNFGAAGVGALAEQVEDAAGAGDLTAVGALLAPLRTALETACSELRSRVEESGA